MAELITKEAMEAFRWIADRAEAIGLALEKIGSIQRGTLFHADVRDVQAKAHEMAMRLSDPATTMEEASSLELDLASSQQAPTQPSRSSE